MLYDRVGRLRVFQGRGLRFVGFGFKVFRVYVYVFWGLGLGLLGLRFRVVRV